PGRRRPPWGSPCAPEFRPTRAPEETISITWRRWAVNRYKVGKILGKVLTNGVVRPADARAPHEHSLLKRDPAPCRLRRRSSRHGSLGASNTAAKATDRTHRPLALEYCRGRPGYLPCAPRLPDRSHRLGSTGRSARLGTLQRLGPAGLGGRAGRRCPTRSG